MRRSALVGGWVVVVILTTTLTWQVVGAVDAQVNDMPASPLNVSAPATLAPSATTQPTSAAAPSTTAPTTAIGSTTSTTAGAQTTATTTTSAAWTTKSTTTSGGTVVVQYRPGEVVLKTATPAAGFRVEIEKTGPPEVKVEFEGEHLSIEFRASWEDGNIDIEVRESEED